MTMTDELEQAAEKQCREIAEREGWCHVLACIWSAVVTAEDVEAMTLHGIRETNKCIAPDAAEPDGG